MSPPGYQSDNRGARGGKVAGNTGKYTTLTLFLYCDYIALIDCIFYDNLVLLIGLIM